MKYLAILMFILFKIDTAFDLLVHLISHTHHHYLFFHFLASPLELFEQLLHVLDEEIFSLDG